MMMAIDEVYATFALFVVEKKKLTMPMRSSSMKVDDIDVGGAAQRSEQIETFTYLDGEISSIGQANF